MANEQTTKTVCSSHRLDPFGKAQKGPGNPDNDLPVIVIKDPSPPTHKAAHQVSRRR